MNTIKNTLFIGKVLHHFEELPSTNAYAAELLNSNANNKGLDGLVVTTFNQTAGRGQMGNTWVSEANQNLAFTVVLNPSFLQIREQFNLNKAISLAVHDFVSQMLTKNEQSASLTEGVVKVKWANDIFVFDKKVSGILIQNIISNNQISSSIIGIGVNVNQTNFSRLPTATSLKNIKKCDFDLYNCVETLSHCLEKRYFQLKSRDFNNLHTEYLEKLFRFEEEAVFQDLHNTYFRGKIVGVSDTGKLVIEKKDGLSFYDLKEVKFCV